MLRRAANNAYSWWWVSHVRTKQSKWLEENMQEIEEKVQYALKLLEDEGDSFAKRAEMYYKRRPELISFVEESFKAYRTLAERYDKLSKELQNANTTIASVFPDQVPEFAMNGDEDGVVSDSPRNRKPQMSASSNQNIPKVPVLPMKDSEAAKIFIMSKKSNPEHDTSVVINKSGLSKTEAMEEIDKLQKEILSLQTEKEFIKSLYENGLANYWEIENRIIEKQGRVCNLQDEFNEGVLIEDEEAQILMSTTALKSCQDKLDELKDKHENNVKDSEIARTQIRESTEELGQDNENMEQEKEKLESLDEKVNEDFESEAISCRTITDIADKIDELVNDVMNLESLFSSQAALIHRLRQEIEDLKAQIRALQKDKDSSETDENTVMRNKLKGIKDIDQTVEEQSKNFEKLLTQANVKLSYLSERLKSLKQRGEEGAMGTNVSIQDTISMTDTQFTDENLDSSVMSEDNIGMRSESPVVIAEKEHTETKEKEASLEKHILSSISDSETEDEASLQKFLEHGGEKDLLSEYTKLLQSHKEVKKMLAETETKLKNENTMKDEQLRILNHKLDLLLKGKSDGNDDLQQVKTKDEQQRDPLFMLIYKEDQATSSKTDKNQMLSTNERRFEARFDALLSENLNLLVKFSNSIGQIQQFDTGIKDLHVEILKIIKEKNEDEEVNTHTHTSNVRPLYKHLREIHTNMTVWLEKTLLLKEEVKIRASTLSTIQNEVTEALKTDSETKFTIYQGAKFEGEISNMKKENNRISEELQRGLDQVMKLQKEVDKTLKKLNEDFSLSESKNQSIAPLSKDIKTSIPLRSFIFDGKPKKQRLSIFSCISPSVYKKKPPSS